MNACSLRLALSWGDDGGDVDLRHDPFLGNLDRLQEYRPQYSERGIGHQCEIGRSGEAVIQV